MQGLSRSEIASALDLTPEAVSRALSERLGFEAQFLTDEARQGYLALNVARVEHMLSKLWPSIDYGDPKAIATGLKAVEDLNKMMQLDKPSSTNQAQVLVIGGEQATYVERLKGLTSGTD